MGLKKKWRPALMVGVFLGLAGVLVWVLFFWHARLQTPRPSANEVPASVQPVLDRYVQHAEAQEEQLAAYTNTMTIKAVLPGIKKQGEFVLERHYQAPKTLTFKPVRFTGDGFVKTNVILGYLSRQAHHLEIGEGEDSALIPANYYFHYTGKQELNGTQALVFDVAAKRRSPGLFDGSIYISPNGDLLRAEGQLVKSPSFFVKQAHFVKDYGSFQGFDLPVHIHSDSDTRMAGHAVMDVYNSDYQVQAKASS